jgi:hypothetical protein
MQAEQNLIALVLRGPEAVDDSGTAQSAGSLFSSEMLRTLSEAESGKRGA